MPIDYNSHKFYNIVILIKFNNIIKLIKVAVVGSRDLAINDLGNYLPSNTHEIVSGGAKGIDTCAKVYAIENKITIVEFLPKYDKYGRFAPLKRNLEIIEYADMVIAFWDGISKGTNYVIKKCNEMNVPIKVVYIC